MVRNVEVLAFIKNNLGCSNKELSAFFDVPESRIDITLCVLHRSGRIRMVGKRAYKYRHWGITNWGNRYLHDQWSRYMGDADVASYSLSVSKKRKVDSWVTSFMRDFKSKQPIRFGVYVVDIEGEESFSGQISVRPVEEEFNRDYVYDLLKRKWGPGRYILKNPVLDDPVVFEVLDNGES